MNLLSNYANFSGRCKRQPFWLFIAITHCILMLLFTPALYLTMLWGAEQTSNPEYKSIFADIVDVCSDPSIINLNSSSPQLSTEDAQAILTKVKPIVEERLAPLARESAQEFIHRARNDYPWHYGCSILALLTTILLIIPSNAITVCRLRDAGFPPAYLLLLYIGFLPLPLMGALGIPCQIALFILLCFPSKADPTKKEQVSAPEQLTD